MLRILGAFLSLVLLLGLFGALAPFYGQEFLWPPEALLINLKVIAGQTVIVALGAIGMTLVIVSAGIDLSVGSVVALSMVVSAVTFNQTESSSLALLAGLTTGGLCGLLNGMVITLLRVVPFVATLGMMLIARGLAEFVANEKMVNPGVEAWNGAWLKNVYLSWSVWILLGLSIVMALVLKFSVFGRYVFAIGSSEATARLCGIRVRSMKVQIYCLCGVFAGLAGVMFFSRQSQGDPTAAPGWELDMIAAVVIGGGSLRGGEGSILGSIIGAFIMGVLRHGLVMVDVSNPLQKVLMGIIIIAAVAIDQLRQRES